MNEGMWLISLWICLGIVSFIWRKRWFCGALTSKVGRHVFITGGSSGIGKAAALQLAASGANLTIVARNMKKLEIARDEIVNAFVDPHKQRIQIFACDITDASCVSETVELATDDFGPVSMLINCAGRAIPATIEDSTDAIYQEMMNTNFFGSVNVTKAVIPGMKTSSGGIITFVSSQAGLLGIFGFSAYSSAKFALRGFAETLAMEVSPYNIKVSLFCPPDTDTPGFKLEEEEKPEETKIISKSTGLASPDDVARCMIRNSLCGIFLSSYGLDGLFLAIICSGMSPYWLLNIIVEGPLISLLRIIAWGYTKYFVYIVKKLNRQRNSSKKVQ